MAIGNYIIIYSSATSVDIIYNNNNIYDMVTWGC